jgi:hypothetical protein
MRKLCGDAKLEEARSYASPVQNMTTFCNRLVDSDTEKYVIF